MSHFQTGSMVLSPGFTMGVSGAIFDKPGRYRWARLNKVNFNPAAVNPTAMLVTVAVASISN